MIKKEGGFSLVIVVIFMSIAAVFVGYLMGSWLIEFLMDEPADQMAQNSSEVIEEIDEQTENAQNLY